MNSTDQGLQQRTIEDFGDQWTRYRDNDGYYGSAAFFDDVFAPLLSSESVRGKVVADIGAGTGRFVNIFLSAGAAKIVAVEPSDAADVLARNVPAAASDRVEIVRTTGDQLRDRNRFDYIFSIGVLHHIPDPLAVTRAAYAAAKPGATMGIWVYGREGNGLYLAVVRPLRAVTKRLPHGLLAALVYGLNGLLTLYTTIARIFPLPLRAYLQRVLAPLPASKRRLVIYDQLNPALAKYYRRHEAGALLSDAGFECCQVVHRHNYSWTVVGRKPL